MKFLLNNNLNNLKKVKDVYKNILVSESRRDEPNISWEKLKKEAHSS